MAAWQSSRVGLLIMCPSNTHTRTVHADKQARAGRLSKAKQFLQVADDARTLAQDDEVADAAATLYIHAGIAAADAICAAALGKYSRGEDHQQAIRLLETVDREASRQLKTLLSMKTRAGYGYAPVGRQDLIRAARAAQTLVGRASQ